MLLNLFVNARDAMVRGGKLGISAENLILDESYCHANPEAHPGPYIALRISDTGSGIPPELLHKIFDPFFTTKEQGKGTGLGLSTVMGIVKSHKGFIQLSSCVGEGTEFKVYLPAIPTSSSVVMATQLLDSPRGTGELILVVDDEDAIRGVARRVLEMNGYRVLTANHGAEGLVEYSRHRTDIRAVITDMVMPVMDGLALIRVLRSYSSDLRIIAMSGLPDQEDEAFKLINGANVFLCKPFNSEQLLVSLRNALVPVTDVESRQHEISGS